MGKKSKHVAVQPSTQSSKRVAMPLKGRRKLDDLVDKLLQTSSMIQPSGTKNWDDYQDIYRQIQAIMLLEKDYGHPKYKREENFDEFLKWLKDHGSTIDGLEICYFEEGGYGLKTIQDIQEEALWLAVPSQMMITSDLAKESKFGLLVESDSLLQNMQNVTLALYLLNELCSEDSFWGPYIKIFPETFDTPMYFKPEELDYLKGSPQLENATKLCRNIARQYAYLYKLLKVHPAAKQLPVSQRFTYDNYRWAVSAVMTRQNLVPSLNGSLQRLAFVPMWDLCNHSNGKLLTDFNMAKNRIESFAFRKFNAGEQVFLYYGDRSNGDFFVHNGFVFLDNEQDKISIKLDLRRSDPLYARKEELLSRLDISTVGVFFIHKGLQPIDGNLLAFHRVIAMPEDILEKWFENDTICQQLKQIDCDIDPKVENMCWKLLRTRISHLLNGYPSTLTEDAEMLTEGKFLQPRVRMALQLRYSEKQILTTAVAFIDRLAIVDSVKKAEI